MKLSILLTTLAGTLALAQSPDAVDIADPVPVPVPAPSTPKTQQLSDSTDQDLKSRVSDLFYDNGVYNLDAIESRLQECPVVSDLNNYLRSENLHKPESFTQKLFTSLFPFGAAGNSILATTYISGPPNFLLALIPPNINPASLNTLVSFAIGGLLGDVFLHLLPQTFVGEVPDDGSSARFVVVDMRRNTILGLAMFGGFLAFIILDKTMRILGAGGHDHDHVTVTHKKHVEVHGHTEQEESDDDEQDEDEEKDEAVTSGRENKSKKGLSKRSKVERGSLETDVTDSYIIEKSEPGSSIKLSAYLNLIADFTHNITDGLAISASFYISKSVGATTCLAVFFHGKFLNAFFMKF